MSSSSSKLRKALPEALQRVCPASLLLSHRLPNHAADYGLATWLAVELPEDLVEPYQRYSRYRPSRR